MTRPEKNTLETILVVEDRSDVLEMVRQILERAGFCVLTAASSTEAIKVEDGFYETIHLLLSDVMMPDMSGPVIAKILKKHRPQMRVMLMSGYPDGAMLFLNHGWHFIEKPFLPAQLVATGNSRRTLSMKCKMASGSASSRSLVWNTVPPSEKTLSPGPSPSWHGATQGCPGRCSGPAGTPGSSLPEGKPRVW